MRNKADAGNRFLVFAVADSFVNTDTITGVKSNKQSGSNEYSNACSDQDSHINQYTYTNRNTDSYGDSNSDRDPNADTDIYEYPDTISNDDCP